jgi:hypothetical protein
MGCLYLVRSPRHSVTVHRLAHQPELPPPDGGSLHNRASEVPPVDNMPVPFNLRADRQPAVVSSRQTPARKSAVPHSAASSATRNHVVNAN